MPPDRHLVSLCHRLGSADEHSCWLGQLLLGAAGRNSVGSDPSGGSCEPLPPSPSLFPVVKPCRFPCTSRRLRPERGFPGRDPERWASWLSTLSSVFPLEEPRGRPGCGAAPSGRREVQPACSPFSSCSDAVCLGFCGAGGASASPPCSRIFSVGPENVWK